MKLRKENQRIEYAGEELVRVIQELDVILISLRNIGSVYACADESEKHNYAEETNRFIDDWRVTRRLAHVRAILSRPFDTTLGDDDMDDLERAMEGLDYWRRPGQNPK